MSRLVKANGWSSELKLRLLKPEIDAHTILPHEHVLGSSSSTRLLISVCHSTQSFGCNALSTTIIKRV